MTTKAMRKRIIKYQNSVSRRGGKIPPAKAVRVMLERKDQDEQMD